MPLEVGVIIAFMLALTVKKHDYVSNLVVVHV